MRQRKRADGACERHIHVNNRLRRFLLYRPQSLAVGANCSAALIALHGSFSSAAQFMQHTKLNALADRHGFIVLYPELGHKYALDVGREQAPAETAFFSRLIEHIIKTEQVDAARVYATGFSSGADLLHYCAIDEELATRISAFAPVCSNMDEQWSKTISHSQPVSMFMISGTSDRLNRWDGIKPRWLSVPDTFRFWCEHNRASIVEQHPLSLMQSRTKHSNSQLYNDRPEYATQLQLKIAVSESGAEVVLVTIHGGGHNWPGTVPAGLSEFLFGKTHRHHCANELIWEFFTRHKLHNR